MADCTEREVMFPLHPVGVKYVCDFCNEGEMQISEDPNDSIVTLGTRPMFKHKCTKCGNTLQLPRSYPYVKFMTDEEYNKFSMRTIIPIERKDDTNDST